MLVHTVLFWLKEGLDPDQIKNFRAGLDSLTKIESAEAVHVGRPAATAERPVLDSSYNFALTVLLKDVAAHDAYQEDPLHQAFITANKALWEQVKIYDAD